MTAPTAPRPIAGPMFRAAAEVDVGGRRRRKLFALVAAFQDAQHDPTVQELADRLGLKPRTVVGLLARLEADGHLRIDRDARPILYTLTLPEAGDRP